jgi:hypothetical protein
MTVMTMPLKKLAFALANTAAVLAALYIAFARDLERPYWAMFTVFIVAKPISGAVRSKAVYRFCGTSAGAVCKERAMMPLRSCRKPNVYSSAAGPRPFSRARRGSPSGRRHRRTP